MREYVQGESLYNLIKTAIPNFVETDYPVFVEFLTSYIRFLERKRTFTDIEVFPDFGNVPNDTIAVTNTVGGALYESRKILEYRDVATTIDEFKTHFLAMFAKNFPQYSYVPLDVLVKSLRQFYQAKGTTDSFKWFFRTLFNEPAEVYFPRTDVLRASDATWSAPITIKVSTPTDGHTNPDVAKFYVGQRIETPTGSAQVESLISYIVGQAFNQNIVVNELALKFDSILGAFHEGQTVVNVDSTEQVYTVILPVIVGVIVEAGGSNYQPGDVVSFSEGPAAGSGYGAFGVVSKVSNTAINGVNVVDGGDGYITGLPCTFISTTGRDAKAVVQDVVYGDFRLEDGSGYVTVEQQSPDETNEFQMEDVNVLFLELLITPFVNANTSYFRTVQHDTPIGYWRLGDTVGSANAIDASGFSRNGTVAGTVTYGQTGSLADGDTAALFNGTTGQINVASTALNLTGGPMSVEVWAKLGAGSADAGLAGTNFTNGYQLNWHNGAQVYFYIGDGGHNASFLFSSAGWHHIVGTWDGTTTAGAIKLYIDGSVVSTGTAGTTALSATGFKIGTSTTHFNGSLDEVAVYTHVLTPTQIANHYALRTETSNGTVVFLDDSDYGADTGVTQLNGVTFDTSLEIALAAVDTKPFMNPWVFTNALETTATLANASAILSLTSNTSFANSQTLFSLTNIQDLTSNDSTSNVSANVIISQVTQGGLQNTLYLKDFRGQNKFVTTMLMKASGNGVLQTGNVSCDGTANVIGVGTTFATKVTPNTHLRFTNGTQIVVRQVVNDTFLLAFTAPGVSVTANGYSIIPVGTVTTITPQAQRFYGKIKTVTLQQNGSGYQTPPAISCDSISGRAQELFYLDPGVDLLPGTPDDVITASANRVHVFTAAALTARQDSGQIQTVQILNSGVNYLDANAVQITATHATPRTGSPATLQAVLGAQTKAQGEFTTSRSFLSSDKFLQDSTFYNDYTYVVRVAESFDRYKDLLLALLHPAGFMALGQFVLELELLIQLPDGTVEVRRPGLLPLDLLIGPYISTAVQDFPADYGGDL
jgi:hypothetical protein